MKRPELLAPAGNMESLYAAIEAGCDAVYLSGYMFGARQFATNFSEEEIIFAIKLCHLYGIKVYVTVNTLIYEEEVETFLNYIDFLHRSNVDAVLIQDIGMLDLVRQTYPNLEVHASTQMHIHNLNGVKFCEQMGIKRVVLARETTINTIKDIRKSTDLELEVFVHGALCISYSGQCLMSSLIGGRSGNRGSCAGSCRLPYSILDKNGKKYNDGEYPISTKDLNTLDHIGELIEIGVDSLKIEGRMKRPEYVYAVVSLYRKAIDSYLEKGRINISSKEIEELKKIFHRGFTKGFLFQELSKDFIQCYRPNHLGIEIGKVIDVHNGYITCKLSDNLNVGDGVRILEKDIGGTVTNLYSKRKKIKEANKLDIISLALEGNIKVGDTLLKTTDKKQLEDIKLKINSKLRKVKISASITIKKEQPLTLTIDDGINKVTIKKDIVEKATKQPLIEEVVYQQINRFGNTIYQLTNLEINMEQDCFVNIKQLNEIRREAIEQLNELRCYQIPYCKEEYDRKLSSFSKVKEQNCLINSLELYEKVKKDKYINIYVEDKKLYEQLKEDTRIILKLPRVIENDNDNNYISPIMISELGGLQHNNISASDFSLNVLNSYSIALLHALGVSKVTLSYELTLKQIKNMLEQYYKRYNVYPNTEVIGYSKIEAMVMKFDMYDYYKTNNALFLVDKFKNKYVIEKRNGYTYILDYKNLLIDNIEKYYEVGVNSIRYQFLTLDDYYYLYKQQR